MTKNKKDKPNITFEPVKNLEKKKIWSTILSIALGLIAFTISFWAEQNLLFIIPMIIFTGLGFIVYQKTYKDTLKTNNLAQLALLINLLVVFYVLIRVIIILYTFVVTKFMN